MNPGVHDALHAFGPQAGNIVDLWRVFLVVCTVVFAAVLVALILALRRAPRIHALEPPDLGTLNVPEPRVRRNVTTAVAIATLGLLVLLAASVFTDRALARMSLKDAVHIEVTAYQWWWSVKYIDGPVSQTFATANEIHVPVGRPVIVRLNGGDVIHSLWVPSLAGKRDLIPGRTANITFRADHPGIFRGQCAEFCGFQHAFMAFEVHADAPADYEAWRQQQLQPAAEPSDPQAQRGKMLFQSIQCAMCHAVQGTIAQGQMAPDLTHLASRRTIAAGTLPNTAANLAAWIADPQKHKPGVNMPPNPMSGTDLAALVAYLGTLK
ncbi:cytochrome c oxidase subunit II [Ramlibacter ginsenosidimutans]|uniref:Cytochrome aa3 subunit 2 n=1 Tax=Ramlibacter ginsenosidimutans TaxID=502333 RepID=A0A934TQ06_9BURK|nr:cytochrome c oxidase subunit II [Ramlibacter ginsenosidimutans]MBK6004552.1 cytochrome c oxidase subunit II [Ramlibacter ginsenosidimutans]